MGMLDSLSSYMHVDMRHVLIVACLAFLLLCLTHETAIRTIKRGLFQALAASALIVIGEATFNPEWIVGCLSDPKKIQSVGAVAFLVFSFSVMVSVFLVGSDMINRFTGNRNREERRWQKKMDKANEILNSPLRSTLGS